MWLHLDFNLPTSDEVENPQMNGGSSYVGLCLRDQSSLTMSSVRGRHCVLLPGESSSFSRRNVRSANEGLSA